MKQSLLVSFISTLAFSLGFVKAGATLSVKRGLQTPVAPVYDAMGIASNQILCRKNAYNKREAYAAVGQAMMYKNKGKYVVAGCESLKVCTRYPKSFTDATIKFKTNGPYTAFPILPGGKLYNGGRLPISDLVVFDNDGDLAGIVYANVRGYFKCLIDDNYVPRSRNFVDRLKYKYRYYTGRE